MIATAAIDRRGVASVGERSFLRSLLLLAIPAVAVLSSLHSVAGTFVPSLEPLLESVGRYLPLLLAIPLLASSPLSRLRFTFPLLAWTIAAMASLAVAVHPAGWSLSGAFAMLAIYLAPWLLASAVLSSSDARFLLGAIAATPAVLVTLACLAAAGGLAPFFEIDLASGSLRLGGIMIAAAWATVGVVGGLSAAMRVALGHSSGWILLLLSLSLIVLAQGRGAGLALIAGSVPIVRLAMRTNPSWRPTRYLLRAMIVVGVFVALAFGGARAIADRQDVVPVPVYLSDVITESDATSGRSTAWGYYLDRWQDQPLFGHGPSSVYVFSQAADLPIIRNHFKAAHNEYVQILVEFGAFGLLLIGGAVLAEATSARRRAVDALRPMPMSILASLAVFSMTDNATSAVFAVSIAMLLAICRSISDPPTPPPPIRFSRAAGRVPEPAS